MFGRRLKTVTQILVKDQTFHVHVTHGVVTGRIKDDQDFGYTLGEVAVRVKNLIQM